MRLAREPPPGAGVSVPQTSPRLADGCDGWCLCGASGLRRARRSAGARAATLDAEIAWARATWPGSVRRRALSRAAREASRLGRARPRPLSTSSPNSRAAPDRFSGPRSEPGDDAETRPRGAKTRRAARAFRGGRLPFAIVWYSPVDLELSRARTASAHGGPRRGRAVARHFEPTDTELHRLFTALSRRSTPASRAGADRRQIIRPYCSGPVEWLACAGGGERPCVHCEEVHVMIAGGPLVLPATASATAVDLSPVTVPPRIQRARASSACASCQPAASLWVAEDRTALRCSHLYSRASDCHRYHPQVHRPRTR